MKNVLLGVVCLDIYTCSGVILPGCGILHNAYHLQQLGSNPLLVTRLGTDDYANVFFDFFQRNHISILRDEITVFGSSASIEVALQDSGEALITNFEPGVWRDFRLAAVEEARLSQASNVHLVMARGVSPEFVRISEAGVLKNAFVSVDCLSFQDFTIGSFGRLLRHANLAFIGWKDRLDHPAVGAIRQVAAKQTAMVVITLGDRGIQVFDSLTTGQNIAHFFPVEPVDVLGSTNGCGDAFIAYFLHEYWQTRDLERAVATGSAGGAAATSWQHALPDEAYH